MDAQWFAEMEEVVISSLDMIFRGSGWSGGKAPRKRFLHDVNASADL